MYIQLYRHLYSHAYSGGMPPSSASMLGRAWTALVPDHVFDFWAERVSPTWSRRRPLARVLLEVRGTTVYAVGIEEAAT